MTESTGWTLKVTNDKGDEFVNAKYARLKDAEDACKPYAHLQGRGYFVRVEKEIQEEK